MPNPTWTYYFARKFSASRFEVVVRVFFSRYYQTHFKAQLANSLVMPSAGGNHAICYDKHEWELFAAKVYRGTCRNLTTFRQYLKAIKTTQQTSLKVAQAIARTPLRPLGLQELGRLWSDWDKAHLEHFLKPIWIPFIIEPQLSQDAQNILNQLAKKSKRLGRLQTDFEVVFGPDYPNAIAQERAHLIALAIKYKQGKLHGAKLTNVLTQHAQAYGFIPCYDVIDSPWGIEHFQVEFKKLTQESSARLTQERESLTAGFVARHRAFQKLLKTLKPSKRERELLQMAHIITFIKDERDDYRRRQCCLVRPLFAELARRLKLPFRAPLYLIESEMRRWFEVGELPISRTKLLERMRGYCLVRTHNSPVKILSGSEMQRFLKQQKFAVEHTATSTVMGLVGNGGRVQGPACLVHTKHDLRRVKRGDILVAVTTNPDYVPSMRLCKAFVTDEGGITSHAAIVARELKLPCVVGTKTATQTFHSGEIIEVDANQGIVRKL